MLKRKATAFIKNWISTKDKNWFCPILYSIFRVFLEVEVRI